MAPGMGWSVSAAVQGELQKEDDFGKLRGRLWEDL